MRRVQFGRHGTSLHMSKRLHNSHPPTVNARQCHIAPSPGPQTLTLKLLHLARQPLSLA